jgi:flagellar hook-basal body complex protein FliE
LCAALAEATARAEAAAVASAEQLAKASAARIADLADLRKRHAAEVAELEELEEAQTEAAQAAQALLEAEIADLNKKYSDLEEAASDAVMKAHLEAVKEAAAEHFKARDALQVAHQVRRSTLPLCRKAAAHIPLSRAAVCNAGPRHAHRSPDADLSASNRRSWRR